MAIRLVVFDLDGTLVDSTRDIATAVNELRRARGAPPLAVERVRSFVGEGVRRLLDRALPELAPVPESLVEEYLRLYRRHLLDTTRPYPGVAETLARLAPGRSLAVLTNKPAPEARRILEGLGLARYFDEVVGGEDLPRRKPDPSGVERLRRRAGTEPAETLLVGDSLVDLETARNAGVPFCLVTYGLGADEALEQRPDAVIDSFAELVDVVERCG